jgi:hypothetical protein
MGRFEMGIRHLLPFFNSDMIFQQDNAACHTANHAKNWLQSNY